MRNFLFVGDKREVLGVWVADSDADAKRLRLKLSLKYPNCQTIVGQSPDFEALKARYREFEFGALEPDLASAV
ncbi:MAG: hypothetical protein IT384_30995 [Deltaproteobacteria bacterium]|nr:hypothetical protein [Deltaproteobacteria bacterium]